MTDILACIGVSAVYLFGVFVVSVIVWSLFMSITHGPREIWDFWVWMVRGGWKD